MVLNLLAALVESAAETLVVAVQGGQVKSAILLAMAFLSGIVSPIVRSQEASPSTPRPKKRNGEHQDGEAKHLQ
jgi:hypothetical protein